MNIFQTPQPHNIPGFIIESPDVAIAYDAGLDSDDVQDFVDDLVGKLGEYFTIGGCLDEMRLGLYKVS